MLNLFAKLQILGLLTQQCWGPTIAYHAIALVWTYLGTWVWETIVNSLSQEHSSRLNDLDKKNFLLRSSSLNIERIYGFR